MTNRSSLGFPFQRGTCTPFGFRRVLDCSCQVSLPALQNRVRCRPASLFARAPARSASNRQDGQVHEPHGAQPVVQEPPQRCVLPPSQRAARRRSRRSALFSRHRETLAARDIHFSRERPTTAWCLRLLRRERPRIRREVFGNAMTHSIASRRRAAWLASQPGPAASWRASAFRGCRVLRFRLREAILQSRRVRASFGIVRSPLPPTCLLSPSPRRQASRSPRRASRSR